MIEDPLLRKSIADLVVAIVERRFEDIEYVDRDRVTAPAQVRAAIDDYGRTLVPLPDAAFALGEVFQQQPSGEIPIDVPLWTAEEGRSDLELRIAAFLVPDGSYCVKLYDVLVP